MTLADQSLVLAAGITLLATAATPDCASAGFRAMSSKIFSSANARLLSLGPEREHVSAIESQYGRRLEPWRGRGGVTGKHAPATALSIARGAEAAPGEGGLAHRTAWGPA
jgi:hypothetical protein